MKRAIALSVIDQGVLSAQSLLFSFLLIRLSDADAVGRFALAMSAFFIFLSVQNALTGTPLMTQVFGRPAIDQARILRVVCTFNTHILVASFLSSVILLAAVGFNPSEIAAAVSMVVSGLLRELSRTISISTGDIGTCLTVDTTAVVVCFAILMPLTHLVAPEIACLVSIAVGNVTAIVLWKPRLYMAPREAVAALVRAASAAYPALTKSFTFEAARKATGIERMVLRFCVMSSPLTPSPRVEPTENLPST